MVKLSFALACLGLIGTIMAAPSHFKPAFKKTAHIREEKGELYNPASGSGTPITGDIKYRNGPVLTGQVNVYYIFYGNQTEWSSSAKGILTNFATSIGGSGYFNIAKSYYSVTNGTKTYVNGPVVYAKGVTDSYSHGSSIGDSDVQAIVADHISAGSLPKDESGIYFVLASSDVQETSGFCTYYCGWHSNFALGPSDIKVAFVGNLSPCLAGCAPANAASSPNNNPGVDGMASVIAHELMESISDPDPYSGWLDDSLNENADKCAFVYGTAMTAANGSKYNVVLGGVQYLIQELWSASTQSCLLEA